MKSIGKSKITKLNPKKNITYPLIRLPQSCSELIGETAHIFKTDHNGKTLFVLSLDEDFDGEIKVVQPSSSSDLESRLERIEKELGITQESVLEDSIKEDSPGRIRTSVFGSKGRKD